MARPDQDVKLRPAALEKNASRLDRLSIVTNSFYFIGDFGSAIMHDQPSNNLHFRV